MKHLVIGTALALSVCAMPASADFFLGAKVGSMSVGFDDAETDTNPVNAGFMAGYEFKAVSGLAAEFEITGTVSQGTVVDSDLGVNSQGIYLSYKTQGQYYVKGRLGLMQAELTGDLAEDEGGETYGVAAGWRFQNMALELDFTSIDDDVSFLSLGFVYSL